MNQQDAYDYGKANGYSAGSYLDDDSLRLTSDEMGYGDPDFLDKHELEEVAESAAWEGEQNARQYAGFSYLAMEINQSGDRAEGLWEKYDDGVGVGIRKGVAEFLGARK